jgi:flagellar protein FlaG
LDDQTKRVVVRLVDATTKEVLRQIPTKDALAITRALSADASVAGLIRASA